MKRIALIAGVVMALSSSAFGAPGAGFETGSCDLDPADWPGSSGAVLTVGDGGSETIQAAVDAAAPGDTILIADGIYNEEVTIPVGKDGLRLQGESRDGVVLDGDNGDGTYLDTGITVLADNVMIENMTGRRYSDTAFYWTHQTGYWGRYLTTYDIGRYGIYAYDSRCGQFDNSYGVGIGDGAVYIGECYPCDAVIDSFTAEHSALGYSGTNAGGNLTIQNSTFTNNALGIVPNSLIGEARPPQRGITIMNNTVTGTDKTAPGVGFAGTYWGGGIVIAGGVGNHVMGNIVEDQELVGILLVVLAEEGNANTGPQVWIPTGNTVWGNTVSGSGMADLAQGAASGAGNCWADNTAGTMQPPMLQDAWSCGLTTTPAGGSPLVEAAVGSQTLDLQEERERSPWESFTTDRGIDPTGKGDLPASEAGALTEWLPILL